ncbi:MAG TPA: NADH kinase [Euryarchaeota archaeon]|mgnify:CR=1 FL=1|nr:NADH kinase [Euryarchaeota archaeon]
MKAGLLVNPKLRDSSALARNAYAIMSEFFEVELERDTAILLNMEGIPLEKLRADFLVSVGGDGTLLWCFQRTEMPILAVNMGNVGYLSESPMENLRCDMEKITSRNYHIDERMKLSILVKGKNIPDAVNEGVIHTAHIAKIRGYKISVDGWTVAELRCDGIIVSTPTGSTCYALSVGSPILDPRLEAFVIAPIAPYKLSARPKVIPASSRITIDILDDEDCILVVDGQCQYPLKGETITFFKSSEYARFIRFSDDVYRFVRDRLPV